MISKFEDKSNCIGTLTFQDALNYGAILQCYALQQSIMGQGLKTEVLSYASEVIRSSNWPGTLRSAKSTHDAVRMLAKRQYLKARKASFDIFKRDCIMMSNEFDADSFSAECSKYSKIIVGSDQVWNPILTHADMNYFLDNVGNQTAKASYAASIGLAAIPDSFSGEIRNLLAKFENITVREEDAAKTIELLTGSRPDVVCDPVMLLDRVEWGKLIGDKRICQKPYILYYSLGLPDKNVVEKCRAHARSRGWGLVVLHNSPVRLGGCVSDNSCDPRSWLKYVRDAELVATSSFHGICFSLIFQRRFICLKNQKNRDVSSRIVNLLDRYGLHDRCARDVNEQLNDGIEWDRIIKELTEERSKGQIRLKNMLGL